MKIPINFPEIAMIPYEINLADADWTILRSSLQKPEKRYNGHAIRQMSYQPTEKEKSEVAHGPTGNGHVADDDLALLKAVEYLSEASNTKRKSPIQDRFLDNLKLRYLNSLVVIRLGLVSLS